jgi:hypothetical protein
MKRDEERDVGRRREGEGGICLKDIYFDVFRV